MMFLGALGMVSPVKAGAKDKKAAAGPPVILHVDKAIDIDSGMAGFASVPSIKLSAKDKSHVTHGKIKGDADLSGDLRLAEDGTNLYVGIEVTQGRGPQNKQNLENIWNSDCVELYLSSKSDMAKTMRLKKSDWDYQVVMAPTSDTGKPVIRAFGPTFKDLQVKAKPAAKGYVLTAVIPLSNLAANDWAPGKSYKFDVAIAKASSAGAREKKFFWHATIDAWDNPSQWGIIEIK